MSRITWLIFLSVMNDVISMRIYMNSQYCTYFMIWLIKSYPPDIKWEEKHLRILKIIKCRKLSEFSKDLLQKDLYCLSETQLSFVILKIISHSLIIWSLLNFTAVDNAIIILILQMRKWNLIGVKYLFEHMDLNVHSCNKSLLENHHILGVLWSLNKKSES